MNLQTKRMCSWVLLVGIWSMAALAVENKDADNVRIVTTGEIIKIDSKKKTFDFRITLDSFPRGGRYGGGYPGGRGGRMGGRGRFPGQYPGRGNVQYVPVLEVKVFTSDRTSFRLENNSSDFSLLKVGERVSITAVRHGKNNDIDAIEISK
jgi:hypothetical protein